MAYNKIEKFRQHYAPYVASGPMGKDLTFLAQVDSVDWTDSLATVIDRMDEVKQFVLEEFFAEQGAVTWQESARSKVAAVRHVERELKCALHETLFILSDVQDMLGSAELALADIAINKSGPDAKAKSKGKSKKRSSTGA